MWFLKRVALYLERLAFDPVENASISLNWFHHVWLLLSNRRKIRRDWLQSLISLQIATDLIESIATAPVLPVFCRCFLKWRAFCLVLTSRYYSIRRRFSDDAGHDAGSSGRRSHGARSVHQRRGIAQHHGRLGQNGAADVPHQRNDQSHCKLSVRFGCFDLVCPHLIGWLGRGGVTWPHRGSSQV